MQSNKYVLKPDVVIEPLILRWYAWAHLVSPATACMNLAYRYLPLMESFVTSPDVHAAACKNPALIGGPFVDLPASSTAEVQQLIQTTKQQSEMILFGEGLKEAFRLLMKNADGFSIEKFYSLLPENIKGFVELSTHFQAHRIFESLNPCYIKKAFINPKIKVR